MSAPPPVSPCHKRFGTCTRYHAAQEKPSPQLILPGLGLVATVWSRKPSNQVFATDQGLPEYLRPPSVEIPQRKVSPHILKATSPPEAGLFFTVGTVYPKSLLNTTVSGHTYSQPITQLSPDQG